MTPPLAAEPRTLIATTGASAAPASIAGASGIQQTGAYAHNREQRHRQSRQVDFE